MLKRRIFSSAVAAVAIASVAWLTPLGATAASAAPAQPTMTSAASRLASPDVITNGVITNFHSSFDLQTTGHNNPVVISITGHSIISQVDCRTGVAFPNGTKHNVCLLENSSGLCIDAPGTVPYLTAESCQVGDSEEYWWAEPIGAPNPGVYWIINLHWSTASNYSYMTETGTSQDDEIVVAGPGHGADAEWIYV